MEDHATVDDDGLAGDVVRVRASEEADDLGNVLRLGKAPRGDVLGELLLAPLGRLASDFCEFLSKPLHKRSLDDTRRVGVDGDAVVRKVTGGDLGQAAHGELDRAVERNTPAALDAGLGGGVEDLVDFFFGDVLERDLRSDAGVDDDDVEAARLGQDGTYPAV